MAELGKSDRPTHPNPKIINGAMTKPKPRKIPEVDQDLAKLRANHRCQRCNRIGRRPDEPDEKLIRRIEMSYVWRGELYETIYDDELGEVNYPRLGRFRLIVTPKNGRWWDLREENLDVVCPTCHSKHYKTKGYRRLKEMGELELGGQLPLELLAPDGGFLFHLPPPELVVPIKKPMQHLSKSQQLGQ